MIRKTKLERFEDLTTEGAQHGKWEETVPCVRMNLRTVKFLSINVLIKRMLCML